MACGGQQARIFDEGNLRIGAPRQRHQLFDCRFVEIEASRKLSWTWVVGDIDTVVTFALTPTPSGTRLSLVQSGFRPDQKRNFGGARYGWRMMGGKLLELLTRIP